MTKELSKQLCELCGIKPKIRYFLNFLDVEYESTKENIIAHAETFRSGFLKIKRVIREYPDFAKPENFARLFNLTLPIKGIPTIAEFVTFEHLVVTDSNDFLAKLIDALKDAFCPDDVKKSIREAEWVYEKLDRLKDFELLQIVNRFVSEIPF